MVYHAFVYKLEPQVRLLLDNVRVNKRANGGGSITWEDMVAIFRDSLAGVLIANMGTGGSEAGAMVAVAG